MQVAKALPIYNPNALPLFREPMPGMRKRKTADEMAAEARQKHRPDIGSAVPGVGAAGKLGATGGTLLTQYVLKTHGLLKNPEEEDVRASILRHAGVWVVWRPQAERGLARSLARVLSTEGLGVAERNPMPMASGERQSPDSAASDANLPVAATPGSSVRGSQRHPLSRIARRQGGRVLAFHESLPGDTATENLRGGGRGGGRAGAAGESDLMQAAHGVLSRAWACKNPAEVHANARVVVVTVDAGR